MTAKLHVRFPKYVKAVPSGCTEWIGRLYGNGYGRLMHLRRYRLAHRVAWELQRGQIPAGLVVCHACDNRRCVNVDHLFLGTPKDNIGDAKQKGRLCGVKGSRNWRSKLSEADVAAIRSLVAGGTTQRDAAERFGVSPKQVSVIVARKQWAHI